MSEYTLSETLRGTALYTIAALAEKPSEEPEVDLFEKPRQAYKLSRLLADPEFEKQVYGLMEQIPKMPGTAQTLYHVLNKKMDEVVTAPIATLQQANRIRRGHW